MFWMNKWEQWNQQSKWSLKHLKKVLLKSSAHEVMTSSEASSSEAPHQKQNHQKLKIIRRWKNQSFKGCSKVLITPSIAEDQKSKVTVNSSGFEGIGCLFFEERWQSRIVRSVQPLPPLLSLCLYYRTRITSLPATMFLHTGNGFEIDPSYNNNHIRKKIIGDWSKLQTTLFDVLAIHNVSFTPLYKEWRFREL